MFYCSSLCPFIFIIEERFKLAFENFKYRFLHYKFYCLNSLQGRFSLTLLTCLQGSFVVSDVTGSGEVISGFLVQPHVSVVLSPMLWLWVLSLVRGRKSLCVVTFFDSKLGQNASKKLQLSLEELGGQRKIIWMKNRASELQGEGRGVCPGRKMPWAKTWRHENHMGLGTYQVVSVACVRWGIKWCIRYSWRGQQRLDCERLVCFGIQQYYV